MAEGQARVLIHRPAADIAEFVMDLRRYAEVDKKLGSIRSIERTGDVVVFRFRPKLLGLPGPVTTQRVTLTPGRRIDIAGEPTWTDAMARFSAAFEFEEVPEGTWVTRRLTFTFPKVARPLLDPLFGRWLSREVPRELAAAKAYLEAGR